MPELDDARRLREQREHESTLHAASAAADKARRVAERIARMTKLYKDQSMGAVDDQRDRRSRVRALRDDADRGR
jgi:hypothetical protein